MAYLVSVLASAKSALLTKKARIGGPVPRLAGYSQRLWAVHTRAHRAGLSTAGLRTAANGYKRKSRAGKCAGVPRCRCNQRDTPKCKLPTCPKFGVPKQGSPGNWHHP